MRGNSDKQVRSFTTGQITSPRKRGARDNRPLKVNLTLDGKSDLDIFRGKNC